MGLAYSPLSLIVLREASPETQGTATSALSLTDSLGTALGTGLTGALVAASLRMTDNAGSGAGGRVRAVHPDRARRPGADRPAAAADRPGCLARDGPGPAAVVDGRTPAVDFGRSRGCAPCRAPDQEGPDTVSAEELRAKIREVPDFPKPGILFYDITTLLKDAVAYKEAIDLMLAPYKGEAIDIVVGMESRGFIFSAPMAYLLGRGSRPGPQAGQAAGRDDHRRIRPRVRLEHARDPPRRDRSRVRRS